MSFRANVFLFLTIVTAPILSQAQEPACEPGITFVPRYTTMTCGGKSVRVLSRFETVKGREYIFNGQKVCRQVESNLKIYSFKCNYDNTAAYAQNTIFFIRHWEHSSPTQKKTTLSIISTLFSVLSSKSDSVVSQTLYYSLAQEFRPSQRSLKYYTANLSYDSHNLESLLSETFRYDDLKRSGTGSDDWQCIIDHVLDQKTCNKPFDSGVREITDPSEILGLPAAPVNFLIEDTDRR